MALIDGLIDITFYGGLTYIGFSAILHAIKWTERYTVPTPAQPLILPAKVGEPLRLKPKQPAEAELEAA